MTTGEHTRFLALLVHRGLLSADDAREAMGSGDARSWLEDNGVVSREQWDEWVSTDAGARPRLTRYELGDELGEGGTARVFRAVDRTDGTELALKVLRPSLSADRRQVEQFVREAKALMDFECEQIVRGYRVAKEGSVYFFAMELVEGECLQETLEREGRLAERDALDAVVQVAKALSYLNGRGLVHRDVKPGNVIRCEDGRCVLIDLGFAQAAGADGGPAGETTAGTVAYIAPEQAKGEGGLDVRADIYALGATLYHLVTGSLPFSGESSEEILRKQVLESLSGERIRDLELSPQVHFYIEKMMAKDAEIRFQDPAALAEEIGGWLQQQQRTRPSDDGRARGRSGGRRDGGRRRRRLF